MQHFIDTAGNVYAYEDDVTITTAADGTTTGAMSDGTQLSAIPTDLKPYTPPQPTAADQLADIQQKQIDTLSRAYNAAITADIQFTSADGSTKTYQADQRSRDNLHDMIDGFSASKAVPSGFFWVAKDNTQVPFTYADLQGLAEALASRGATAFARFQTLKAQVKAATTDAAVQAIVW